MTDTAFARATQPRTLLSAITFAALPLFALACGSGGGESTASSHGALSGAATLDGYTTSGNVTAQTSTNWARLSADANDAVENNDWGIPQNGQGGSTIFTESLNGQSAFGWAWNVYDGTGVAIFPEVGYGWSPNGNASWGGNPTIPQLSAHQTITTSFDIVGQHSANSNWDMAFDIWITSSARPSTTVGSYELMIWLDHNQNDPWSTEGPQGLVSIDGVSYQRYTNAGAADWTCLTYINQGAGIYSASSFNVSDVINDAAAKFGISDSFYVASIEFGNEAINGSGMTEISNWTVDIGATAPTAPTPPPTVAPDFSLNAWQYNEANGVTAWNGGVGNFVPGNWIAFNGVDLSSGYDNYAIWYATTVTGTFDLHLDSTSGPLLCTVGTWPTGGWNDYTWGGCDLNESLAQGVHDLYLVATSGASNLGTMWIKNM